MFVLMFAVPVLRRYGNFACHLSHSSETKSWYPFTAAAISVSLYQLSNITDIFNMESFANLIKAIGAALGPTSGLDCEEVDHDELIALMEQYGSDEAEWSPYALGDSSRNYTRNLVDNTNGKSNILVVVWV